MAAASAIMLTACTSEDDILQTGQQKQAVTREVGFDVYTPAATNATRAGLQGTMTTNRLQRLEAQGGGFGVYAFQTTDDNATAGDDYAGAYASTNPASAANVPNFMVNEKLLWNATNQGWYYNPLKYWPNETDNDSQTPKAQMEAIDGNKHLDRLSFFAYAPYVPTTTDVITPGITNITDASGLLETYNTSTKANTSDPTIGYMASLDNPNEAVDLVWGVAPAGGLTYTAVNGRTVTVKEGMPLINMTKPDVNTTMKFLFNHALARIGIKAVAAVDQVGAGGKLDPNTRITIEKITLTGYFGVTGDLNLNNSIANVANWTKINGVPLASGTNLSALSQQTITIRANNHATPPTVDNVAIAQHLRYKGTHTAGAYSVQDNGIGVTTVKQDVIEPANITDATPWYTSKTYVANELKYSETTPYYDDAACTTPVESAELGTATGKYYTLSQKGVYTAANTAGADATYTYPAVMIYYDVTFHKISGDAATYATSTAYTKSGDASTITDGDTFTPKADLPADGDWVIDVSKPSGLKVPYYAAGKYYKRDANYFMVVPTNNIANICTGGDILSKEEKLRTVRVKIEYYVTTEDEDVDGGRTQTKNVVEKDVVFPSIANGKSYNLNLILGLTSVKMEAEVDDWKVINVNADLPQNTAGE